MIASSRIKTSLLALTFGTALGATGVSSAVAGVPEEPSIHSLTSAEIQSGALTIEQGNDGIRYVSGGIGVEERAWLAAHSAEFNTQFTFAVQPGGAFVSDVHVVITSAKGHPVLDTTTQGPKLLVKLPAGNYQVTATHDGQSQRRSFAVAGRGHVALGFGFKK